MLATSFHTHINSCTTGQKLTYPTDANHPGALKMPPIQPSPLLHRLLNFLKKFRIIGDKLWKLGIRQVSFLQTFFQRCSPLIIGRFTSKSCRNRPSTPCVKADHHSHGVFDNVDCFHKLPTSFFGAGWQRSTQSLPLHHEKPYYPDLQTRPSTSQALVPYSTTPMARDDMNMSTLRSSTYSSTTTRAEDDCHRDPPGLSDEISDFVGVTSAEFERYDRNFTSYVLTTHQ